MLITCFPDREEEHVYVNQIDKEEEHAVVVQA